MAAVFCQFEKKVNKALKRCLDQAGLVLFPSCLIGVAVSGGADSVSLLYALKAIAPCRVVAVTVNHNLRGSESERDALFAMRLCEKIGVECTRYDIPVGQVNTIAHQLSISKEAAARKVRYRCFDEFIEQKGLCALCLAHNREDQLETVLMRFLQGSASLWGIPATRGKFIRPLLNVSRKEILSYLDEKHTTFCTDSTNADIAFLRNKIRLHLAPLLNEEFAGWQEGVLTLVSKARADEDFIQGMLESSLETLEYREEGECVSFSKDEFFLLHQALRRRVLKKALDFLMPQKRVSHSFLDQLLVPPHKNGASFFASGIAVHFQDSRVLICKTTKERSTNLATEHGFFAIITKDGVFEAGGFRVQVSSIKKDACDGGGSGGILLESGGAALFLEGLCFPFVFRSRQTGDVVRCADGSFRSAAKVMADWRAYDFRGAIPFVQQLLPADRGQPIRCIWGGILGFKDWIVELN